MRQFPSLCYFLFVDNTQHLQELQLQGFEERGDRRPNFNGSLT